MEILDGFRQSFSDGKLREPDEAETDENLGHHFKEWAHGLFPGKRSDDARTIRLEGADHDKVRSR
jgi:hypothetical protein